MFKSDASLFLEANNSVGYAKTLINECKSLIVNFKLEGNEDSENLINNINNCDIDALVTKIEETKEGLMKVNESFASEYMTLLHQYLQQESLDISNMSEEEKMQYNIQMSGYYRDYNYNLLYMLEEAEKTGNLTPEMKYQLEMQRTIVKQYEIQDEMAILDPISEEYIELFKQNAECDRQLIMMNPELTEEEKNSYLQEYNIKYNENLKILENIRTEKLKNEQLEQELKQLYASKEENNGFWHPFVEGEIDEAILDKKIEMGIATEDEIAYKNMNGWNRFWTDTGTFGTSTYAGLFDITEGIGDGFVMLGSAVGICDKEWASEYISVDLSGELYDGIVLSTSMNTSSAYGTWNNAGMIFGNAVGKVGMSFAAPWANAALNGLEAMGKSAENAFNSGDDYWTAFAKSAVSGVGGAAEGYGLSMLNMNFMKAAKAGTFGVIGKSALSKLKNVTTALFQPGGLKLAGNSLLNLGKAGLNALPSALKTAGLATLKDVDTWVETGCVLANNIIEGATTGEWDFAKMAKETGAVLGANYFLSAANDLAFNPSKSKFNSDMDSMTDAEKTQAWEDYFKQKYGAVEHTSGVGIDDFKFVDPFKAPTINNLGTPSAIDTVNTVKNYVFDRGVHLDFVDDLLQKGYSKEQIIGILAQFSNNCSEYYNKRAYSNFSYELLLAWGYDKKAAGDLLKDIYNAQLAERGMSCVMIVDGVKYNVVNGFNSKNQVYTIEYITQQLRKMPSEVRASVTEINIYDTFNPYDYYWEAKYNSTGQYFKSAATGGSGKINIWSNEYSHSSTIFHEAAHCFDKVVGYEPNGTPIRLHSGSSEYLNAMKADGRPITEYGSNNATEDFAETLAVYYGGYHLRNIDINQFPNRKVYIEKNIKVNNQSYLSIYNKNRLDGVYNTLAQKYGSNNAMNILHRYVTTQDILRITRDNDARSIVESININEVIEYYNLLATGR